MFLWMRDLRRESHFLIWLKLLLTRFLVYLSSYSLPSKIIASPVTSFYGCKKKQMMLKQRMKIKIYYPIYKTYYIQELLQEKKNVFNQMIMIDKQQNMIVYISLYMSLYLLLQSAWGRVIIYLSIFTSQPFSINILRRSLTFFTQATIISLETLFYGSLIASRISNDTLEEINARVDELIGLKKGKKLVKFYCSSVIMRIPHYNGDFEQPWYWGQYGQNIYRYSFYCDKYNTTKDPADLKICTDSQLAVPREILQEYKWRRSRNHQVLMRLLNIIKNETSLRIFNRLYITLDDSAQFGDNAKEAKEVMQFVKQNSLSSVVLVYPGADEVSLTLLSTLAVDDSTQPIPVVSMIFRNSSTVGNIPNYQGLPMIQTLENQIRAAGGTPINGTILRRGNVAFLVNNFDEPIQMQAPSQGPSNQKSYSAFDNYVCLANKTEIIGFADNRYSNGGDVFFVNYLVKKTKQCRNLTQWTYAGWNTNGNTLGTVVSNSILLWVFRNLKQNHTTSISSEEEPRVSPCKSGNVKCANSYFNSLRILEDKDWQVILRELTRNYIYQTPGDNINDLSNDLPFYEQLVLKSMSAKFKQLKSIFDLQFSLSGVYFPWNRTFQIGLYGKLDNSLDEGLREELKFE